MEMRRLWSRAPCRRRAARIGAVLLVAVVCASRVPAPPSHLVSRLALPRARADRLAHLLADFSTQPPPGAWRVEEERGNYSEWRYRVSFECGPRCAGEARVHSAAAGAPRHGLAPAHAVSLALTVCSHPPLLPWFPACDETEVEATVRAEGAGCVLEESARARCGALRALSGACARALRDHRRAHLARLRDLLPDH